MNSYHFTGYYQNVNNFLYNGVQREKGIRKAAEGVR
jgi:hypothetical protein